jgi:rhodanese-related sulfurtransferase
MSVTVIRTDAPPSTYSRTALHAITALLLASCGSVAPPQTPAARQDQIEALYQDCRQAFPDVNEVTPQGVLDLQEAEPTVLVDVRTPKEQAVSMLPGAITQEAFEAARDVYRGQTVVAYCTIGARSGEYAEELRQEGFEVFNLKGSILAWTHAGLPLMDPEGQETKRVHTYGRRWNLTAKGYEATW